LSDDFGETVNIMGGYGSGRGWSYDKKETVEDHLAFSMQHLLRVTRADLNQESSYGGWLHWTRGGEPSGSIRYWMICDGAWDVRLQLLYTVSRGDWRQEFDYVTPIRSTPCHFGGRRYWFQCYECGRRCWRLHQSPRTLRFVCRTCADLRYQSSQEAHKYTRLWASIAAGMGGGHTAREVEQLFRMIGDA
jgi:hypothetical protein